MGAGHDSAARVLRERLRARGAVVETVDLLALPTWRQGDLLRSFYKVLIGRTPRLYDYVMRSWIEHPGFYEFVTTKGAGDYERGLISRAEDFEPDVVVSTYNLAAQALGRLRARDELAVPVISYVTDPGAHPYWVAPKVDHYAAPLAETAAGLREFGADPVTVCAPLVYVPAVDRDDARTRWRLPADQRIVLVNGGSWGVGSAAETAALIGRVDGLLPVVLCGRSEQLRREVKAQPGCRAVPWTDDMASLFAAADVVVDNAGGTTCWEALAVDRPVVLHRAIPGHGPLNARTLVDAGLATWAQEDDQLIDAVRTAEPPDTTPLFAATDVADLVAKQW